MEEESGTHQKVIYIKDPTKMVKSMDMAHTYAKMDINIQDYLMREKLHKKKVQLGLKVNIRRITLVKNIEYTLIDDFFYII